MEEEKKEKLTVKDLCRITGRSRVVIYKLAKRFGRLPTVDEVLNRQTGRPPKYFS